MHLAIAEPLLAPLELREPRVDLELLLEDALLDLRDLDAAVLHLALDLAAQRDRLLARVDLRLAPDRLGLALRVREQLARARLGALRTRERDQRVRTTDARDRSDEDSDERCAGREHGASVEDVDCPRRVRGCSHPASTCTVASGLCRTIYAQVVRVLRRSVRRSTRSRLVGSRDDRGHWIQKSFACRKNVG